MALRARSMPMMEALEARLLMAGDAGSFLVATPVLASNSFLMSQFGGVAAVQLSANQGVVEALSLQSQSPLDLTASRPTAFLGQQYVTQQTQAPAVLPDSMVAAAVVE